MKRYDTRWHPMLKKRVVFFIEETAPSNPFFLGTNNTWISTPKMFRAFVTREGAEDVVEFYQSFDTMKI